MYWLPALMGQVMPPPRLDYLSYFDADGVLNGDDGIGSISCDEIAGERIITIAGQTMTGSFPFLGETVGSGDSDSFVTRLVQTDQGLEVLWSTRLDGPGVDGIVGLDVDEAGRVVVAGWAQDGIFTTPGAFTSPRGYVDAFVALLSPNGNITYANAFGGAGEDMASAVAFDETGGFTVVGRTESFDFPLTGNAFQTVLMGPADEFVVRIRPDRANNSGADLLYATYLGGSNAESCASRFFERTDTPQVEHIDPDTIVVVGDTRSADFPVTDGGLVPVKDSARTHMTVLACSEETDPQEQLVLSSVVGGSGWDRPGSLLLEDPGTVVVGVVTWSGDFPTTPGAYRTHNENPNENADAVIFRYRLDSELEPHERLLYSTYVGGDKNDLPKCIALLEPGKVVVAGATASTMFPGDTGSSTLLGSWGGFIVGIDMDSGKPADEQLLFHALVGGSDLDQASSVSLFPTEDGWEAWVVGVAFSSDLPVTRNALQAQKLGSSVDGFIAAYQLRRPSPNPPTAAPTADPPSGTAPVTVGFSAGASDPDGDPLTFSWWFDDPTSGFSNRSSLESPTHTFAKPGEYDVRVTVSDGTHEVTATLLVSVDAPTPRFLRGNANADGATDLSDAVFTLNYLFTGGQEPPCYDSADADDSGVLDITDAVYLLNYLFLGGPEPPAPFPACGIDPTDDALSCASFPACEGT